MSLNRILFCLTALAISLPAAAQSALKDHDTYQPLDISAERLEVKQKLGRAIFKGDVKVIQGKMTLTADALTVFYTDAEGTDIERLDAAGNVSLKSATETVTGDWGIYDVAERLVTLGGKITLERGENILRGERLELNLISGLAKLDGEQTEGGRVRGRFNTPTQKKNNGTDEKNGTSLP